MSNASSKRSVMTLFSNKNDIYCHQVKIVLAEKGVAYENEEVEYNWYEEAGPETKGISCHYYRYIPLS